eukprot:snap_masked-scaffold_10-processed-gene-10.15-mRNA-1 protein AED:0.43 eAED:0.44 QI:0/0/0/0.5/1/1/2/0/678
MVLSIDFVKLEPYFRFWVMKIIYATQTNTAYELAVQFKRYALRRNVQAKLFNIKDISAQDFSSFEYMVLFVSTTGDGQVPDGMKEIWAELLKKTMEKNIFKELKFSIFCLGDSSYQKFNAGGRMLRKRLIQLGATEFYEAGLGDDQSKLGVEYDFLQWNKGFWDKTLKLQNFMLPAGFNVDDSPRLEAPRYILHIEERELFDKEKQKLEKLHKSEWVNNYIFNESDSSPPSDKLLINKRDNCRTVDALDFTVNRNEKVSASHEKNDNSENGSMDKDVRFLEFFVENQQSSLVYKSGDVAIVYPCNTDDQVKTMLKLIGATGKELISIYQRDNNKLILKHSLVEILTHSFDCSATLTRGSIEQLYFLLQPSTDGNNTLQEEKNKLLEMLQLENIDIYESYIRRERRSLLDFAQDFNFSLPLCTLFSSILRPTEPREYSICSSPRAHGLNTVQIVVSLVKFLTPRKRLYKGKGSVFLSRLKVGSKVKAQIKPGVYIPSGQSPLILIGPGTGVAPCRSILYECLNNPEFNREVLLIFGCRRVDEDFLFKSEFLTLLENQPNFSLCVCFSRHEEMYTGNTFWSKRSKKYPIRRSADDSDTKLKAMYVQHGLKIPEIADVACEYLVEKAGVVYVCGTAKNMPTSVFQSFADILSKKMSMTTQQTEKALLSLQRKNRYILEVWS